MTDDRQVHARSADGKTEIVRYNRAGRWAVERSDGAFIPCRRLTMSEAVDHALLCLARGGEVFFDRPGGKQFDRKVRSYLQATARS